jgi:hypothetical protein
VLEITPVVVHFKGKAFNPISLLAYQLVDIGEGSIDDGS